MRGVCVFLGLISIHYFVLFKFKLLLCHFLVIAAAL